ncbi:DUF4175 domain-containing protein [Thalassospira sp. TSL5-1]|uniref:DUF4175 domain-containing protein n=1 Tax=Thalassospira sp. TSL5-1 TaxID=1544451 RepID=UPI000939130F|nr:DUF4175 family protein [Thalassospira sp. TSL5-1]
MLVTSARLERRLTIARHILTWEKVWPRLIPVLAVMATVFGLALTGILALLPPLVHIALLAVALIGIIVGAVFVWRAWQAPTAFEVMARLEAANHLAHTPIQNQRDTILPSDDTLTSYLWQRQLRTNAARTQKLHLPRPRAVLAKMDPFGLSVIPVLLLFVGILSANGKYGERLSAAFDPIGRLGTAQFSAKLWVTPPAYTGKIPRTINPATENNITYFTANDTGFTASRTTGGAAGSRWNQNPAPSNELSAQKRVSSSGEINYGFGTLRGNNNANDNPDNARNTDASNSNRHVHLRVPAGTLLSGNIVSAWKPTLIAPDGHERALGEESGNHTYSVATPLNVPGDWNVTVWGTSRLTLSVDIIPDMPPVLAFIAPPTATKRDHVHLDYIANDDYGMRKLELVVRPRFEATPSALYGRTDAITIDLTGPRAEDESDDRIASDNSGTVTASAVAGTAPAPAAREEYLPAVNNLHGPYFLNLVAHPWAGLPVNLQLVATDNAGQTAKSDIQSIVLPERKFTHPVARKLIDIRKLLLRYPGRVREWRNSLYPVLNAPQAYGGDIGIFLGLSVATARLSAHLDDIVYQQNVGELLWHIAEQIERGQYGQAERNLIEAEENLLKALSNPDISEQQISDLIERYRQALNEYMSALAQQDQPQQSQNAPLGKMIEQQDLSRVIDQIGDLMRSGARNEARNLIEQLRQLVENMQVSPEGQGEDMARPLRQMLDGMRDLARRQQDLMDQGDQRSNDAPSSQSRARSQQQLSDDANALTQNESFDRFGQSSGLQSAIDAMKRATEALTHGRQHEALQQQQQALQNLRNGIGTLGQALEGLSKMMPMLDEMGTSGQRDPLGRPVDGGNGVRIPDADTLNRTWRILQELRRRSSDPQRPKIEHDYIDRLLKRF